MQEKTPSQNSKPEPHGFEAIFKYASLGIIVTNKKGLIQNINPFALKLFGYNHDETIGKSIEQLIPKRYHKKHRAHTASYFQKPKKRPMHAGIELLAIKKNGTEIPVEICLTHFTHQNDMLIAAFITDITKTKKSTTEVKMLNQNLEQMVDLRTNQLQTTMEQLKLSKQQLEETSSIQKSILANAGAMIIATDTEGIIKVFNPEAERELGYSAKELINCKTPLVFHDIKEIALHAIKLSNELGINITTDMEVFFAKARLGLYNEYEWTYKSKNGFAFPVLLNITALKDNENRISGYLGIALNISDRKKTELELQSAFEKEKELNELKSRFVSMASHEFRTPLSTVLSSAYLIEKYSHTDEQEKRQKHLQRIISSVNMLTDTLNDFLSVGKIEEGKIQVRLSAFNISEFITGIIKEIKNTIKKKQKIQYEHQGQTDVLMDPSLVKHIIMNLVSNASKFSDEESSIIIKSVHKKNDLILSVKDNGIGISKEDQQHLMERFFRGSNAGNIQGTGLGLHIVDKYTELMNGKLACKSELGKGTEFILTFNLKTG